VQAKQDNQNLNVFYKSFKMKQIAMKNLDAKARIKMALYPEN